MEHQKAGVQWLLDTPKGMLAWQMRTGKTATALRAWENSADQGPLLVICPATGREMWRREAIRWSYDADVPPNVQVVTSVAPKIHPASDVVVTNYDQLLNPNVAKSIRARPHWGSIVLDEAHYLKNPSSQRTKLVYGGGHHLQRPIIERTDRVWPLTGTPIPNHPGEIYPHARTLWPDAIRYKSDAPMELWQFELGFCQIKQGKFGYQVVGGKNLDELKQRLAPYVNRLLLKDVIDMPPVRIDTWPLDMETTGGVRVPDAPELLEKLERFGRVDEIEQFDNDTLQSYLTCIESEAVHLATLRRETGTLKAIATTLLLRDEFENGADKQVVFAYSRDAIETMRKGLKDFQPAVLHGGTKDRYAEVDRFNEDPNCKPFIGQIQAAGEIIDLSVSNSVVFSEQSWTPGVNEQAMFRVLGTKQKRPVFVRFCYLPGSVIDEAVARANARKAAMIAQVFN